MSSLRHPHAGLPGDSVAARPSPAGGGRLRTGCPRASVSRWGGGGEVLANRKRLGVPAEGGQDGGEVGQHGGGVGVVGAEGGRQGSAATTSSTTTVGRPEA